MSEQNFDLVVLGGGSGGYAAALRAVQLGMTVGLIEKGTLAGRTVGKHRRLSLRDVLAYKAAQFTKREQALNEIVAMDQELGLI